MPSALLSDRAVLRVSGDDARAFLDRLVTCDLDRVTASFPRFGALLTPQGKIIADFIVFQAREGAADTFYLDTAASCAQDLAKRLSLYKLRAKVAVEVSDTLAVRAGWDGTASPPDAAAAGTDPRLPALGWRAIVERGDGEAAPRVIYHAHRIELAIPEGGADYAFGDAFPHEAMMDQLHGVDFDKGCYVGQEVVSRMQHRGTARTRIVPLLYDGNDAPEPGAEVVAGERALGRTGTAAGGRGLAMIRLDRAADALAEGQELRAGGRPVRIGRPDWVGFAMPGDAAKPAA